MKNLPPLAVGEVRHFHNPNKSECHYPDDLKAIFSLADSAHAFAEITQWSDYQPTSLYSLRSLAQNLEIAEIYYKDESTRLGLGSFKALGGAYGVLKLLQQHVSRTTGHNVTLESIRRGCFRDQTSNITVVTATDGNHGRSVAWGAKSFGCACRIYIHAGVSKGRRKAMEQLGATVIRINGNYDESVHLAATEAAQNNWHIISDTSYEGYMEIPRYIMAGYSIMAEEILSQIDTNALPSHVFLQGGVGGLASAVCAYFWEKLGSMRPKIVVVEPTLAPCLMASAIAGKATSVEIKQETIMAGLSCGEVSMLSWAILRRGADDFLSISDEPVPTIMRLLAKGSKTDPKIVAGEFCRCWSGRLNCCPK